MNKKTLLTAGIILLSSIAFSSCEDKKTDEQILKESMEKVMLEMKDEIAEVNNKAKMNNQMDTETLSVNTDGASYTTYSLDAVNNALGENKKVALYFHADWCGTCNKLQTKIKDNLAMLPKDAIIFVLDFDKETDLKAKYGITTQTTLVYLNGNVDTFEIAVKPTIEEITNSLNGNHKMDIGMNHKDGEKCDKCSEGKTCEKCEAKMGEMGEHKDGEKCDKCSEGKTCEKCEDKKGEMGEKCDKCSEGKMCEKCEAKKEKMEVKIENGASYVSYSLDAVNNALGENKKVALYFHADWCGTCNKLQTKIKDNLAMLPKDAIIFVLDFDKETDLKAKYGITTQTTLVYLNGNVDTFEIAVKPTIEEITNSLNMLVKTGNTEVKMGNGNMDVKTGNTEVHMGDGGMEVKAGGVNVKMDY